MGSQLFSESEIPWMQEDFPSQSTSLPEIIEEESKQITTVVIFVISAILTITLLFVVAIFIDCRQQKLQKLSQKPKRRRIVNLKVSVPRVGKPVREDEDAIVNRMENPEPSTSVVVV